MKRILLMVIRNLIFVPYWWIKLCWYAAHTDDYPEKKKYAFLKHVDDYAIKGGNIHIDVHGAENIPRENGFMFFPNHQGLFVVLAIIKACPVPFSVVAKKEVADIPFLKQVFACMKAFIIDREDLKQSMQVIVNVIREVKAGRNYLIFPEGTRSKDGKMLPFKEGSMKMATKTGCPIIPIAISNSAQIWEAHFPKMKPAHVVVEYGAPIYPKELSREEQKFIGAYTQQKIQEMLDSHQI